MKRKNKLVISEEERRKLRQNAIIKEFYRLKTQIKRKNKIIVAQRIAMSIMLLILCSFLYLGWKTQPKELKDTTVQINERNNNKVPVQKKVKPIPIIYHTVYFSNEQNHPLAQFKNANVANEFCDQLHKIQLPPTKIIQDTIYRSRQNLVIPKAYPYEYAVQLGAYHEDVLKKYRNNLIWMVYQHNGEYHRYRIAPFYGYSKSLEFTNKIDLKDCYILPY